MTRLTLFLQSIQVQPNMRGFRRGIRQRDRLVIIGAGFVYLP